MKYYNKILVGYVIQTFTSDGKFVEQEFIHGDTEWENSRGDSLEFDDVPDVVQNKIVPVIIANA